MKKEIISRLHRSFEDCAHLHDGVEYWLARELQALLGYTDWRNFLKAVDKAREACRNSEQAPVDHFVDVNKMVDLGSGAQREVADIMLTRYACYLIAQNGDPKKAEIAFAMTYFAVQTRRQELIEARIAELERVEARGKLSLSEKELSGLLYERGVDGQGFARIRSKGDAALFGGRTTQDIAGRSRKPCAGGLSTHHHHQGQGLRQRSHCTAGQAAEPGWRIGDQHVQTNLDVRKILTDRISGRKICLHPRT